MKKKLFAILMSAMMLVTFMPMTAFAGIAAESNAWITLRSTHCSDETLVEKEIFANFEMVKDGGYKTLTTAQMQKWVDKKAAGKNVIIIDAMPIGSWNAAHIPGAVDVEVTAGPYFKPDQKVNFTAEQKNNLKKAVNFKSKKAAKKSKATIIVYCGYAGCDRSHYAAKYLKKTLGYKNVYRYIGGGAAWEDANLTMEDKDGKAVAPHTRPAAK